MPMLHGLRATEPRVSSVTDPAAANRQCQAQIQGLR